MCISYLIAASGARQHCPDTQVYGWIHPGDSWLRIHQPLFTSKYRTRFINNWVPRAARAILMAGWSWRWPRDAVRRIDPPSSQSRGARTTKLTLASKATHTYSSVWYEQIIIDPQDRIPGFGWVCLMNGSVYRLMNGQTINESTQGNNYQLVRESIVPIHVILSVFPEEIILFVSQLYRLYRVTAWPYYAVFSTFP